LLLYSRDQAEIAHIIPPKWQDIDGSNIALKYETAVTNYVYRVTSTLSIGSPKSPYHILIKTSKTNDVVYGPFGIKLHDGEDGPVKLVTFLQKRRASISLIRFKFRKDSKYIGIDGEPVPGFDGYISLCNATGMMNAATIGTDNVAGGNALRPTAVGVTDMYLADRAKGVVNYYNLNNAITSDSATGCYSFSRSTPTTNQIIVSYSVDTCVTKHMDNSIRL
jgi:hypothetical protein